MNSINIINPIVKPADSLQISIVGVTRGEDGRIALQFLARTNVTVPNVMGHNSSQPAPVWKDLLDRLAATLTAAVHP